MANGVITWNGVSSDGLGIIVRKVPSLNRPRRKHDSYSVPGRNGNIVVMQDAYEEYEQDYEIFMLDDAQTDARTIADWLFQDGYCELKDDWEPNHYRLAYFVGPLDIETILEEAAVCTVTFRCRPERYLVSSKIVVENGESINNPTNYIAKPIITLTGNGAKSLLDLTGLSMRSQSTPVGLSTNNLQPFIDAKSINSSVLWVKKGSNNTTVTYADGSIGGTFNSINNTIGSVHFSPADNNWCVGIVQAVNPDTDYVISVSGSSGHRLVLWYGASEGYNQILGIEEPGFRFNYQFHTPANCGYILVGIGKNNNATVSVSGLMLNTGTTKKTFKPYNPTSTTFSINDITLQFTSNGFDTAELDCERENFVVDDANANGRISIVDSYGNPSVEFLQLDKGANTVNYSSEFASVTVEPRFWEL